MKHLNLLNIIILIIFLSSNLNAQVKIGDNPTTINSSSLLELESTDKGILIPRMTTAQRDAISGPASGLEIYNTSTSLFNYYDGSVWQVIESRARDNHVLVKSVSDFPSAVGGVITLNSDFIYEINGSIIISDKIDLNGAKVYGLDVFADQLVYVGSSELFTGSNGGSIRNLFITASVSGSQVFNLADLTDTKSVLIKDCIFYNCKKIGSIEGYSTVYIYSIGCSFVDDGFSFKNNNHLLIFDINSFSTNKGTMIELVDNSTFLFIEISGGFFHPIAANSATALDFGTGVTVMHGGSVITNFHGDGTLITGTPSKDWDITSHGVNTQSDEVAVGDFHITTIAITDIAAVDTPIKIVGTTTSVNLFRVTSAVDNRLTYEGTKTRAFQVMGSLSLTASNNGKRFNFYIAKNGAVLNEFRQRTKIANGADVVVVALSGIVSLAPGDYIEVWVENTNDASDVTVESMNLSIF